MQRCTSCKFVTCTIRYASFFAQAIFYFHGVPRYVRSVKCAIFQRGLKACTAIFIVALKAKSAETSKRKYQSYYRERERAAKFYYQCKDYLVYVSFNYSFFRRNNKQTLKMDKNKLPFSDILSLSKCCRRCSGYAID